MTPYQIKLFFKGRWAIKDGSTFVFAPVDDEWSPLLITLKDGEVITKYYQVVSADGGNYLQLKGENEENVDEYYIKDLQRGSITLKTGTNTIVFTRL